LATPGVPLTGWHAISSEFSTFASLPADAISYPLRIAGDTRSGAVEFVDTPAFFSGQELRSLSTVTIDRDHKIIRWVDYWDGRSSLIPNTVTGTYPANFRDSEQNADPAVVRAAAAAAPGPPVLRAGARSAPVRPGRGAGARRGRRL
jgi:hypothetical protein